MSWELEKKDSQQQKQQHQIIIQILGYEIDCQERIWLKNVWKCKIIRIKVSLDIILSFSFAQIS